MKLTFLGGGARFSERISEIIFFALEIAFPDKISKSSAFDLLFDVEEVKWTFLGSSEGPNFRSKFPIFFAVEVAFLFQLVIFC